MDNRERSKNPILTPSNPKRQTTPETKKTREASDEQTSICGPKKEASV